MTMTQKTIVTITDQAGGKTVTAELPSDAQMSRLIPALVTKMGLPNNVQYGVQHKETGRQLQPQETLISAGVADKDTLRLLPNVTAGGGFPISTYKDVQLFDAVIGNNKILAEIVEHKHSPYIFALFLYTDEDELLANYIRQYIRELSSMSGQSCFFFVIEKPSPEWIEDSRKYLGDLSPIYTEILERKLGQNLYKPFDKAQAYEIAERFSIKPKQLPCILFFERLESEQILIVEINDYIDKPSTDEYRDFFRCLFSYAQSSAGSRESEKSNALENLANLLHADKRRRKQKKTKEKLESINLGVTIIETIFTLVKSVLP